MVGEKRDDSPKIQMPSDIKSKNFFRYKQCAMCVLRGRGGRGGWGTGKYNIVILS